MANYLKQENQLIVWPVFKEAQESDMFLGNIGLRALGTMTTKELLEACLEAWQLNKEDNYKLVLVRADKKIEVPLEGTVKEVGIRNGDFLEIIAA